MSAENKRFEESKNEDPKEERSNKGSRPNRRTRRSKGKGTGKPKMEKRGNNPNWYFSDAGLAEQVSQLAFQNLAGYPIEYDGTDLDVPNIVRVHLNPSPGVQTSAYYNTGLAQNSAMNMAAFRLYSKLSAFTGRVQSYAPQDVAMMELAFSEMITMTEVIRRMFGVCFTMNMRNRDYPKQLLDYGMLVDADDLFANFSDYRTRFNTLVTLMNQLPIPKNVAYFDKCASLYEKVYVDAPSDMAQTILYFPESTWELDESSYAGGSILKTVDVVQYTGTPQTPVKQLMSYYLSILQNQIGALLNSSSLQIIYTDILNLASKTSFEFWKLDYLLEGYAVMPQYDANFLLQFHNCTITNRPRMATSLVTSPVVITPYNDVYPDPNKNSIYYNPAFSHVNGSTMARTGNVAMIDMLNSAPTLEDRVEVTRFISICKGTPVTIGSVTGEIDTALPDHYVTSIHFETQTSTATFKFVNATVTDTAMYQDVTTFLSNIDWSPHVLEVNNGSITGRYVGEVNYYTTVDERYLRKLHDFVGLALYDVR